MLLKEFYKYSIDIQEEGKINAQIEINQKHSIFAGHFPEFPVVPGVCQVLMIKEILNEFLDVNLQLKTAKSIKFLSVLNPFETNKIRASISYNHIENETFKVNAILFFERQNFLKLKAEFSEQ